MEPYNKISVPHSQENENPLYKSPKKHAKFDNETEEKTTGQKRKIVSPEPKRKPSDPYIQATQAKDIPKKGSPSNSSSSLQGSPRKSIDSQSSTSPVNTNRSQTSSPTITSGPSSFSGSSFRLNSGGNSFSKVNLCTYSSSVDNIDNQDCRQGISSTAAKITDLCQKPFNSESRKMLEAYVRDLVIIHEKLKISNFKDEVEAYPAFWASDSGKKASKIINENFLVEPAKLLEGKQVIGGMVSDSEVTRQLFKDLETWKKKTQDFDEKKRREAFYNFYSTQQKILSLYWDALVACTKKISDYKRQKFIPAAEEILQEEKKNSPQSPKRDPLEASKDISTETAKNLKKIDHYFSEFYKKNKNQTILPEKTIWDDVALRLNRYEYEDFLPTFVKAGQECLKAKGKFHRDSDQTYLYRGICLEMLREWSSASQTSTLAADQDRAIKGKYLVFVDIDNKVILPPIDDQTYKNKLPNEYEIKIICDEIFKEIETNKELYQSFTFLDTFLSNPLTNPTQFNQFKNQVIQKFQKDFSSKTIIALLESNAKFIKLKSQYPELDKLYFSAYQNPIFFSSKGEASLGKILETLPSKASENDQFKLNKHFFISKLQNLIHGPLSCAIDDKLKELMQEPVDEWVEKAQKVAGEYLYGDQEILKTIGGFIFSKLAESPKLVIQQKIFECMNDLKEEEIAELDALLKTKEEHKAAMEEFHIMDILKSLKKIYRISSQVFMTTITKKIMDSFAEIFSKGTIIKSNPQWLAEDKWRIEVMLDKGFIKVRYLTKGELFEACTIFIEMTVESNFNRGLSDLTGLESDEKVEIDMYCETPKNLPAVQAEEVEANLRRMKQLMNILDFGSHFNIMLPTSPRKYNA